MAYRDNNNPEAVPSTTSICEDVLEQYRSGDDTLAGLIERNHIEVRDFMILSFVCDQGSMSVDRIKSALGLSRESILSCVERLKNIELVIFEVDESSGKVKGDISPSMIGKAISQKIHSGSDTGS